MEDQRCELCLACHSPTKHRPKGPHCFVSPGSRYVSPGEQCKNGKFERRSDPARPIRQ